MSEVVDSHPRKVGLQQHLVEVPVDVARLNRGHDRGSRVQMLRGKKARSARGRGRSRPPGRRRQAAKFDKQPDMEAVTVGAGQISVSAIDLAAMALVSLVERVHAIPPAYRTVPAAVVGRQMADMLLDGWLRRQNFVPTILPICR